MSEFFWPAFYILGYLVMGVIVVGAVAAFAADEDMQLLLEPIALRGLLACFWPIISWIAALWLLVMFLGNLSKVVSRVLSK